jgi:hypothetical protein
MENSSGKNGKTITHGHNNSGLFAGRKNEKLIQSLGGANNKDIR